MSDRDVNAELAAIQRRLARGKGVYLMLHPDGHWIPATVGRWRWWPSEEVKDAGCSPMEWEVFEKHGSLMYRPAPGSVLDAYREGSGDDSPHYDSIRMHRPGVWEWVTPVDDEEITP